MKKSSLPVIIFALILSACAPATSSPPVDLPTESPTLIPTTLPDAGLTAVLPSEGTPEAEPVSVTVFPDAGNYAWNLVLDGFIRPVNMAYAADNSGRIFIL